MKTLSIFRGVRNLSCAASIQPSLLPPEFHLSIPSSRRSRGSFRKFFSTAAKPIPVRVLRDTVEVLPKVKQLYSCAQAPLTRLFGTRQGKDVLPSHRTKRPPVWRSVAATQFVWTQANAAPVFRKVVPVGTCVIWPFDSKQMLFLSS